MLPSHVFADVVKWLHLYDLDALLLTDARCSELAQSAASKIRTFDFSEYELGVYSTEIYICNLTPDDDGYSGTVLEFLDATDLVSFVSAALRNCTVGNLVFYAGDSFDAISEVARTIVVKGTLRLWSNVFIDMSVLVEFVVSFRSVERVCVCAADDSQIQEIVNVFDRRGFALDAIDRRDLWVSFIRSST